MAVIVSVLGEMHGYELDDLKNKRLRYVLYEGLLRCPARVADAVRF